MDSQNSHFFFDFSPLTRIFRVSHYPSVRAVRTRTNGKSRKRRRRGGRWRPASCSKLRSDRFLVSVAFLPTKTTTTSSFTSTTKFLVIFFSSIVFFDDSPPTQRLVSNSFTSGPWGGKLKNCKVRISLGALIKSYLFSGLKKKNSLRCKKMKQFFYFWGLLPGSSTWCCAALPSFPSRAMVFCRWLFLETKKLFCDSLNSPPPHSPDPNLLTKNRDDVDPWPFHPAE